MSKTARSFNYLFCVLTILVLSSWALADDAVVNHDWSATGISNGWTAEHEDAEPFKGSVTLNVTNTGLENWGDFHFKITDYTGMYDISNVDFVSGVISNVNYDPSISINGTPLVINTDFTFSIDNSAVGATMDLFFYDNPVTPGDSLQLVVYTDNTTDSVPFFGLCMYPTPVPEPATIALLGLGSLALLRRKSRA